VSLKGKSMGEFSLKTNKCRNCNHHHAYLPSIVPDISYYVSNTCLMSMNSNGCGCYSYIPLDNLEYLEYILREKNRV